MTKEREVLIYPGSPKTGTSALQAVLRCSVAALKAAGWNYLHDPLEGDPGALGSGNALRLFAVLNGASDLDLSAEVDRLAPPGERSIIACEALAALSEDQWSRLFDLFEAEGSSVRTVLCVRDLYPFVWSAHGQQVSAFHDTQEFGRAWLESMGETVARQRLFNMGLRLKLPYSPSVVSRKLLHYETIRGDLVRQMLEAGGLPLDACRLDLSSSTDRPLNRSLTQAEVALMRQINANTDEFRAEWCGLTLTRWPSPERVRPVFVPEANEWLIENLQGEVDAFNAALPPGTDWQLKVFDESDYDYEDLDPHPELSPVFSEAIYHLLSFEPSDDLRDYLISLLPGGVYDPPPPPGFLRRAASRAKQALVPG